MHALVKGAVEAVVPFCAMLFGIFDAAFPPRRGDENSGPTRGPGIKKLIEENLGTYQDAFDAASRALAEAAPPTLANYVTGLVGSYIHVDIPEPGADAEVEEEDEQDEEEHDVPPPPPPGAKKAAAGPPPV